MGVQVNLKDIQTGFLSAAGHTANNTLSEAGFDRALDRTSNVNNSMLVPLDMGGQRGINLGEAVSDTDIVSKGQAVSLTTDAASDALLSEANAFDSAQAAGVSEDNADDSFQAFALNYAGSGPTLPSPPQPDGIRFHYTGAAFDVGEYIYLEGTTDPITGTPWVIVSGIGPVGPTGPEGIQGAIGVTGPQGSLGVTGPQGIEGPQGVVGPQGPIGVTGIGEEGPLGPQGVVGPQGVIGVTGATGGAGPQGVQGVVGPQGEAGSSFTVDETGLLAGRSAFDNELEGFSFLATDTSDLYIRETAVPGVWSAAIAFGVGPTGATGATGIQGPQGSLGPTGAEGPDGPQGITGVTGTQGDQGTTGATGLQGPQGIIGIDGQQGDQGIVGVQGPQGLLGVTGATGPQGSQGNIGNTGLTGNVGPTGPQGVIGNQGIRGSRSFYSTRTVDSWSVTQANSDIPDTPLENDISVQFRESTGFSETRVYDGNSPPTSATNWDVVDQTIDFATIVSGGVETVFNDNVTGTSTDLMINSLEAKVLDIDDLAYTGSQDFAVRVESNQTAAVYAIQDAPFDSDTRFSFLANIDADKGYAFYPRVDANETATYGCFTGHREVFVPNAIAGSNGSNIPPGTLLKVVSVSLADGNNYSAFSTPNQNILMYADIQSTNIAIDSCGIVAWAREGTALDETYFNAYKDTLSTATKNDLRDNHHIVSIVTTGWCWARVSKQGGNIGVGRDLAPSSTVPGALQNYQVETNATHVARALAPHTFGAESEVYLPVSVSI